MEFIISVLTTLAIISFYIVIPFKLYGKTKFKDYFRFNKKTFLVYLILRLLVIFTMIRSIYNQNYYNAFLCVEVLILFLLPMFIEKQLKIELPTGFEIIILCFIFSAEILGEINSFYTQYQGWDTILHTLNGFLCAAVGFSLIDIMNRSVDIPVNMSPFYIAFTAFCFSMTVGVLWEFFEFGNDYFSLTDAQKDFVVSSFGSIYFDPNKMNNVVKIKDIVQTTITTASGETYIIENGYLDIGIIDTMKDLFVNFIGAIIFCVSGYFYKKHQNNKTAIDKFNIANKFMIKVDK